MAPPPKPEGARQRRNLGQRQWRRVTRGAVPVPQMPAISGLNRTQYRIADAYWVALWTDLGALFTDADRFPIARLCKLHALAAAGRLGAQAQGELRQLETAFGGSPYGRARLMVNVVAPTDGDDGGTGDGNDVVVDLDAQRVRRARMEADGG